MSTTGHAVAAEGVDASDAAATIRAADHVHLLASPDADALAATGVLARARDGAGQGFQATVTPSARSAQARADAADDGTAVVAVGTHLPGATLELGTTAPATADAAATVAALDADPDLPLALAGLLAADATPGDVAALPDPKRAGIEARPGVAVPTDDAVDGLAHATLVHAPFSGDVEATRDLLDGIDAEVPTDADRRDLASAVALAVAGDPSATERAATAVECVLRPDAPGGPFATVGGYADVLDALAHAAPGRGVALALGAADAETCLETWRDHGRAVHAAVRDTTVERHRGLVVARTAGPVGPVARLLADYRSPEPVVLAIGDDEAALVSRGDLDARDALDGAAEPLGTATRARAGLEDTAEGTVEQAVREAV